MTEPDVPPSGQADPVADNRPPAGKGGIGDGAALLIGGLVVVVLAVIVAVMMSNKPDRRQIDIEIDLPRPVMPDGPTLPEGPVMPPVEPPTLPQPGPVPADPPTVASAAGN